MLLGMKRISTALGVLAASAAVANAQGVSPNANQATANAVAASLRSTPGIANHRIDIEAKGTTVTLSGVMPTAAAKAEVLNRARMVRGVALISDALTVGTDAGVRPVQYQVANGGKVFHRGAAGGGGGGGGDMVYEGGAPGGQVVAGPTDGPMPEGPAGMAGATQASAPGAPNYAWPSYAPYPNYSAVGYPTVYPWQAWPNIGPPHPYPEVPLDWRAVTLRWDDGIWWLDFKKHYTRPFFTPYPFGLFAY